MLRGWARAQRARGKAFQPRFALRAVLASWLGGPLAITCLGLLSAWSHYGLVVAAPFGGSLWRLHSLALGHRHSPLAQPRNIVLGNTLAAGVGVACVATFDTAPSVGVALFFLGVTVLLNVKHVAADSTHPTHMMGD